MARIRTIKPEFFLHEGLAQLSPLHRILFQGLWCHADREGRLEDRPRRLLPQILPYEHLTDDLFDGMLWDLAEHPDQFIVRYQIDGRCFIAVPSFLEHQRPHPKDPQSIVPSPENGTLRTRETPSPVNFHGKPGNAGKRFTNSFHAPLSKSPRVQESKSPNTTSPEDNDTGTEHRPTKQRKQETWLSAVGDVHTECAGGAFPFGQAAKVLKPLVDAGHTPEEIAARYRRYCERLRATDRLEYLSVSHFAATFGAWAGRGADGRGVLSQEEFERLLAEGDEMRR